jgi:hypothetical protein
MRIRSLMRGFAIIAATIALSLAAPTVAAQVPAPIVLQVKQGSIWTDRLSIADTETMYFRWKIVSRESLSGAPWWQIQFETPTALTDPEISSSDGAGTLTRPAGGRLGEYAFFQITPNQIPTNSVRTLYVRVWLGGLMIGHVSSAWIPVTYTSRTTAPRPLR